MWAAFGVVVLVASWRVDRLENLHINPWSIPGLLPGIIGALMIVLAAVLALRAPRVFAAAAAAAAPDATADDPAAGTGSMAARDDVTATPPEGAGGMLRAVAAAIPCVLFALLGPATGLPFAVDAAVYVAVFIALFSWPRWRAEGRIARRLLTALAIAVISAAVISWLFESVFLVRLP